MERTADFRGVLKLFGATDIPSEEDQDLLLQAAAIPSESDEAADRQMPTPASDFAAAAATVAKGFQGTLRLVQRLQKLVTRKGLHNDPTAEIEDVTAVFKKDLGGLQRDIDALLRYAETHWAQGTRHGQRHRHCACVVEGLRQRAGEHTKMFQEALQVRQSVLKDQSERRRMFTHSARGPAIAYDSPLFVPPPPPPPPQPHMNNGAAVASSRGGRRSPVGAGAGNGGHAGASFPPPPPPPPPGPPPPASSSSAAFPPPPPPPPPQRQQQQLAGQQQAFQPPPPPPPSSVPPPLPPPGVPPPPPPPSAGAAPRDVPPPPQQSPAQSYYGLRPAGGAGSGPDAGLRRRYAPPPPPGSAGAMGGGGGGGARAGPMSPQLRQQQYQGRDTAARLQDARAIEKAISELGQTFQKMAGLVAAQSELVVRIDDDMEMALEDVRKGHTEMQNYLRIVKGNRGVIVKTFAFLIAFIVLFIRYF